MSSPLEDYLARFEKAVMPKMAASAICVSILSDKIDAKICLELGAAILYEKPLVIVAVKGAIVPPSLRRLADKVLEIDEMNDASASQVNAAVQETIMLHFPERLTDG